MNIIEEKTKTIKEKLDRNVCQIQDLTKKITDMLKLMKIDISIGSNIKNNNDSNCENNNSLFNGPKNITLEY